jgi:YHS domain-containing protein
MKNFLFVLACAGALLAAACSKDAPHLGKVVDGYLVNVDDAGVILQGYDPVSFRHGGALAGDPAITSRYHGAIYRFATAENKAAFEADPAAYEPAFGGYCAYGVSVGHLAPIELWTYDSSFQNLNLFQHNQKAINGWQRDVAGNYRLAEQEWVKFQKQYLRPQS